VANETPGQSSFNKNGRLWNDLVVSLEGENIEKKENSWCKHNTEY